MYSYQTQITIDNCLLLHPSLPEARVVETRPQEVQHGRRVDPAGEDPRDRSMRKGIQSLKYSQWPHAYQLLWQLVPHDPNSI